MTSKTGSMESGSKMAEKGAELIPSHEHTWYTSVLQAIPPERQGRAN